MEIIIRSRENGRDVGLALETMMCMPTPEIVRHINYEQGRGLPITKN